MTNPIDSQPKKAHYTKQASSSSRSTSTKEAAAITVKNISTPPFTSKELLKFKLLDEADALQIDNDLGSMEVLVKRSFGAELKEKVTSLLTTKLLPAMRNTMEKMRRRLMRTVAAPCMDLVSALNQPDQGLKARMLIILKSLHAITSHMTRIDALLQTVKMMSPILEAGIKTVALPIFVIINDTISIGKSTIELVDIIRHGEGPDKKREIVKRVVAIFESLIRITTASIALIPVASPIAEPLLIGLTILKSTGFTARLVNKLLEPALSLEDDAELAKAGLEQKDIDFVEEHLKVKTEVLELALKYAKAHRKRELEEAGL